ncbi:hypothetical protein AAIR98_000272 [Elusimicrobium simillimum]|uniref:hypothetical protein n=1 Tax=Elusimicrobium simillimum TaxID=3143438 RepID=UPI003C6F02B5
MKKLACLFMTAVLILSSNSQVFAQAANNIKAKEVTQQDIERYKAMRSRGFKELGVSGVAFSGFVAIKFFVIPNNAVNLITRATVNVDGFMESARFLGYQTVSDRVDVVRRSIGPQLEANIGRYNSLNANQQKLVVQLGESLENYKMWTTHSDAIPNTDKIRYAQKEAAKAIAAARELKASGISADMAKGLGAIEAEFSVFSKNVSKFQKGARAPWGAALLGAVIFVFAAKDLMLSYVPNTPPATLKAEIEKDEIALLTMPAATADKYGLAALRNEMINGANKYATDPVYKQQMDIMWKEMAKQNKSEKQYKEDKIKRLKDTSEVDVEINLEHDKEAIKASLLSAGLDLNTRYAI